MGSIQEDRDQEGLREERAKEQNKEIARLAQSPEFVPVKEYLTEVSDSELLNWGDLTITLYSLFTLSLGDSVYLYLIDQERDRRGLSDPDFEEEIDPDIEKLENALQELPPDYDLDSDPDGILGDLL
jgi:hypothetical protein